MNAQQTTTQQLLSHWLQAPQLNELTKAFGSHLERIHPDSLTRLIATIAVAIEFDLTPSMAADESKIWYFTWDEAHQEFDRAIAIVDSLPREFHAKLLIAVTSCLEGQPESLSA
ncbi:hypothetical protein IQ235_03940 [Oscillatoriales cyanobacterium LEGE 11467]|uniref:Uncharacterized protein n=1 Tax=Zarconia navalis LEGE 11467 TaxID=1828826 RepID=A0A928VXG8_9CYAN|nr:hypothetical protein [Zarconia navalis]MBE9039943.1 hypothetical protein [Zarconia navalis LEGE 11467]